MMSDVFTLQLFKDILVDEYRPEKIILFGSQSQGRITADSDFDILVILNFEGESAIKSAEILNRINPHFPIDLLVRTPDQVKERLKLNDFFMREIIENGTLIYENPNA